MKYYDMHKDGHWGPARYYRMTEYDRHLLPNIQVAAWDNVRINEKTTTHDVVEGWKKTTGLSIGYPAWNLLYYSALSHLDPKHFNLVIETGTNIGCSAIMLGQAIKDSERPGVCETIEIAKPRWETARRRVATAGLSDYVNCNLGSSLEVMPELFKKYGKVRIAFLDGNHDCDHVIKEFEMVYPHLQKNAIVLFDNTSKHENPPEGGLVHEALTYIQSVYEGNLVNFEFTSWGTPGFSIWQGEAF